MSENADCVIIGGGITGASIAYHLTQLENLNVILLEKDALASKATGICPGGVRQQFSIETACLYARESVRFFENLDEELHPEFPLPFKQAGYLFLAHEELTLKGFRANVELQNRLDIPSEIVGPDDVSKLVPGINTEGLLGASFCGTDGFLEDATGLTETLLRRAKERGAQVQLECGLGIELFGDRVVGVLTSSTFIDSPIVVNAAGCDSPVLARPLGLVLPIEVGRRRLLFTDRQNERVLEPLVAALDVGWAGKQLIDGVIYMGYLRETMEDLDDWAYTEKAVETSVEVFPGFQEMSIKRLVDGYYDSTPDGQPFLGGVDGLEGYFQAAGFSGHGFMLAPAVGRVMAELILGRTPSLPVEPFSYKRFQEDSAEDQLVI